MSLLSVDRIDARHGLLQAVREVSLEVEEGETVALVGANGAGKTTLLRSISGLVPARTGRVSFEGRDITRLRKVRTSAGASTASRTETIRSSRSELLITICASPVHPTMRVSRWRTGIMCARCSISCEPRPGLLSGHSLNP